MKEQGNTYDPFQFQSRPIRKKFSFQEKLIAIILVVIFMMIPLYEINKHTFQINGTYFEYIHSCFGFARYWQPF